MDLLELVIKKLSDKPIMLDVILPLMKTLKVNRGSPEGISLSNKISAILDKKLYKGG
jgi:hypothetical protein